MGPWKRLQLNFAGPYERKMFLVIVDAYSKYLEIVPMRTITSSNTIAALRHLFSHFGLPDHIVMDNGAQFTSNKFRTFLRLNNILHIQTVPANPPTNELAERYVGHVKTKNTQMKISNEPLSVRLNKFLFTYRATPTTIGRSTAELLMNRQPKKDLIYLDRIVSKTQSNKLRFFKITRSSKLFSRRVKLHLF